MVKNTIAWYSYMNSFSQGISGSDACFINIAKELSHLPISHTIITSNLGKVLCVQHDLDAHYQVTSNEKVFRNVYLVYLKRILSALLLIPFQTRGIFYSSSDFLPDVLPAFVHKSVNTNSIWIQKIFHLIPRNRIITYVFQRMSFLMIQLHADIIIVDNASLKTELVKKFHFDPDKITIIPPGINIKALKRVKPALSKYDAIFIGQLRESKGIYDLVEIWTEVLKKFPTAKLAIVGKDVQNNHN